MSIWTEFKGDVRIHKDENFSIEKSFHEIFHEGYVYVESSLGNDGFRYINFRGSTSYDLEEFISMVKDWFDLFPSKKRSVINIEVTHGRFGG